MPRSARSEVIDERPSRLAIGLERIRLPIGAVEGQHLLCAAIADPSGRPSG